MASAERMTRDRLMLRSGLDILDEMVKRMEAGGRIEIADAATILRFIGSLAAECLSEQSEGFSLVAELEQTLRHKKGRDFVRDSRRLGLILRMGLQEPTSRPSREWTAAIMTPEIDAELSHLGRKYVSLSTRPVDR